MRIVKGPVANIDDAVTREFTNRIECLVQLIINRKCIILIGKAQF